MTNRAFRPENISVRRIEGSSRQSGFALPGVLFLSLMISAMVPIMVTLNRENVTSARADQVRASAAGGAQHMFTLAHAYLLMHGGLPVGWRKASSPDAAETGMDLANCSGYAGHDDETWRQEDARVFRLMISEESNHFPRSRMLAGIYRTGQAELAFEKYVVIGCVITAGAYAQGAALRGEFARTLEQLVLLDLDEGTT